MCITPNYILNPNRIRKEYYKYGSGEEIYYPSMSKWLMKDCKSSYIAVPCGKCVACRSRRQTDFVQRVQMESLTSYIYMFTLTYNKNVPTYSLPNGKVLMCHNVKHVQDMFKRIRKQDYFGRRFKYLVSFEYTPKHARPHVHGLLFLEKLATDGVFEYINLENLAKATLLKEWRVNVATRIAKKDTKKYHAGDIISDTRRPKYIPLCDYKVSYRNGKKRSTYDLHFVDASSPDGSNDCSFYVTKYLFKLGSGEKFVQACCYNCGVSKIVAPELYKQHFKSSSVKSLGFGKGYKNQYSNQELITPSYVPEGLSKLYKDVDICRKMDLPLTFFDIYTGKPMPLSKYYASSLDWSTQSEFSLKLRKYLDETPAEDINLKYTQAMVKYKNQSKKVMLTDVFDDDQIFEGVSFPDDLPDPGFNLDSRLPDDDFIRPAVEDFEDLPEAEVKVRYVRQLSFDEFWNDVPLNSIIS